MPKFNPPDCFLFDKPVDWPEWKQRFLRFRTASKLDRETAAVQVSLLVYAMGCEACRFTCACNKQARTMKASTDL